MKRFLQQAAVLLSAFTLLHASEAAEPLRVFIRGGQKSHAPGAHEHEQFVKDWVPLLKERGIAADGGLEFPTKEQLDKTDVLILHSQEGGNIKIGDERKNLMEFLGRGGGLVVIHAAAVSRDHDWFKNIIGGSWHFGQTKWLEGPMHLYFTDRENPITKDCSNWEMDDEIYYDMDVLPEARILAGAYTPKPAGFRNEKSALRAAELTGGGKKVSIYDIQPQIWTYERSLTEGSADTPVRLENNSGEAPKINEAGKSARAPLTYRAFVSIPGHWYKNFDRPNYRAILLRGIAWAGKRANADEFLKPEEAGDNLRYVEGGPTRPEKAAEKLEVHPDFDISLVASEPLINKVMNLDWDPQGRLWVCETPEYPNGRRELNVEKWKDSGSWTKTYDRDPIDRISILTDTDGDGRMDKKHVFADKLELVTSFCFYKKGVIACAAPDIWYLEDTDGDEVADKRTKLYMGLGTGDTHAVINNLRWGLDGWVYATHGYSAGHVTSPEGDKDFGTDGSGVVRFKPDGSAFAQYSSKGGNTWGLDITWDGQVFWTQPTSGTVFFHTVLPEYVLAKGKIPGTNSYKGMITGQKTYPAMSWPEQAYVQIDLVGQFTAAAGCAIYEGGAWPEKWNYSYFTTEPTLNIVHHEFVKKDGVSYSVEKEKGREETEFIRSKDLWFRPIETRIGPDGALYVVDFYNQAVIHNDTRGPIHGPANAAVRPDRDHYYGRIWKVQHKQAKKIEVPALNDFQAQAKAIKSSPNAHSRKQALRLVMESQGKDGKGFVGLAENGVIPKMGSAPLREYETYQGNIPAILDLFVKSEDDWSRSAMIAASASVPVEGITAALASASADKLAAYVEAVTPMALPAGAAKLIEACAQAGDKANALKVILLQGIAQQMNEAIAKSPAPLEAFKKLLANTVTAGAVLPIVSKWDNSESLADAVAQAQETLIAKFKNNAAPMSERIAAIKTLVSLNAASAAKFGSPALADDKTPEPLQTAIIEALGDSGQALLLVESFTGLKTKLKNHAFDQILKRPEACLALLKAIGSGQINPTDIGPGNISRLRSHPNKQVSKQANAMVEKLNPNAKAKNEIIAKLTPEVEKPGNAANGKMLFTAACAVCHKYNDIGLRDVGPPLAGMGSHGPGELIIHIVDPNREVDPSFWQWNITKKNGETLAGVITSENQASLNLRNQAGDFEVKKEDIATRENTRRSLMPEGLDGLGAEALRDILTFICGGSDSHFRVVDLREAYTADSRRGAFRNEEAKDETITLHKFGNVTVKGVPFFIMDPAKSATGSNLIMLKGGGKNTAAGEFPQRVEIPVHANGASLHFLGGVAGWGWPFGGDNAKGKPAMKVSVEYIDGDKQDITLNNGEYFADYIGHADVPLSEPAGDFVRRGQLRYFAVNLKKKGELKKLILESFDNGITPGTVAVTVCAEPAKASQSDAGTPARSSSNGGEAAKDEADKSVRASLAEPKEGGKGDGPLLPATPVQWETGKTKVLVIGGGSSHNFAKFFGDTDVTTLRAAGFSVHYTEDRDQAASELKNADVAVISVNRKFFDTAAYRKALMDFAAAGKGIIMYHPGTWYGYTGWPELNAQIVGGGARGHDKIHPFEVKTVKAHPIMEGVPASFTVEDELYYVNAEADKIPEGTAAIDVLAETSPSNKFNKPHPSIWITKHPTAKVVGIALGHDERVHDLEAFKTVLRNAVKWSAGK